MTLNDYLNNVTGRGILATADGAGRVDAAIYAKPHTLEDGSLAFIMRDHLTHSNTRENPYATYLFIEDGRGYRGIRLFLKKIREDDDPALAARMTRRSLSPEEDKARGPKFVVCFSLEKILPLVGSGPPGIEIP